MLLAPPGPPCRVSCAAPKLAAANSAAAAVVANKTFLGISVLLCLDQVDPQRAERTKTSIDCSRFSAIPPNIRSTRLLQRRCARKFRIVDLRVLNTPTASKIAGGGILSRGENAQPRAVCARK